MSEDRSNVVSRLEVMVGGESGVLSASSIKELIGIRETPGSS